ncbi:hypothetical protein HER32_06620 [Hymenobacter sp. BT18]|uniref:hypothetical protein n=1 Tax=Hymenobacter sp. BT18 TaxID=2835648 RepID=UPI00143EC79E|nr:hypothetical protein [Hymenobacter sp. BT18]QIX60866.1 hypothetical protein HER32_06620 [Hymenobacter sp. BT18]
MAKNQKDKKPKPPIGFGQKPDEEEDEQSSSAEEEAQPPRQPLVEPIFVDDVEVTEILAAYNLYPLTPLSKFEYQLVEVIAALEQRLRAVDPEL